MEYQKLKFFLESQGETYELPQSPSGWESTLVEYVKSPTYYGMLRSMTVPLEFVTTGATILRRDYYTKATAAATWLIIQELNSKTLEYEQVFRGKIDYSKFKDGVNTVTINAMEEGLTEFLKAYEKVVYEIPLNTPYGVKVELAGIGLTEIADAIVLPDRVGAGFDVNLSSYVGTDIVTNELESEFLTAQSQTRELVDNSELPTSENWFLRANEDTDVSVSFNLTGIYGNSSDTQAVKLTIRNQNMELLAVLREFWGFVSGNQHIAFTFEGNFTYSATEGEKLFLLLESAGGETGFMEVEEGSYSITNSLTTSKTEIYSITAYDLYRQLLQKMAGNTVVPTNSFLLTGEWKKLKITSGDAIRGLPNPVIKTSFEEFFKAMNAVLCVGFGIENGIAVLEKKEYFNRSNTVLDLGEVSDFENQPALSFLHSSIKAGYANNDYESDFGREEFNAGQVWTLPNTRVQTPLDIVSPYRADQFGIEELRTVAASENTKNADKEGDSDTFMLVTKAAPREDGVFEMEGAEAYTQITGLSSRDAYYNLAISPKKNLLRHGAYIRGAMYGVYDRSVLLQSADKNKALVTVDINGVRVAERDNISIGGLPDPYFIPMEATVNTELPIDAVRILDAGIYGRIRFTVRGAELFGLLLKAGVNLPRNTNQKWELLLAPNSNLQALIR